MVDPETLFAYANNGLHVQTWEIIFYVAVMSFYAFLGRARSCLINSFAFTFYWGFMYLLPRAFSANGLSQTALIAYAVCGLGIYTLTTLAFQTRNEAKTR